MRRPLQERLSHSKRRGKGQKKNKKKMAYVGAVYTINRFDRCPDDVIDEVRREEVLQNRPKPKHKRVWVEMTQQRQDTTAGGKTRLFDQLGSEVESRNVDQKKPVVCLMDGERALWTTCPVDNVPCGQRAAVAA